MAKQIKYTEKVDKKQDAKMLKGASPKVKAKFEKLDMKHKKVKTLAADIKIDKKLLAKAKKK